jgi:hypothetical protein
VRHSEPLVLEDCEQRERNRLLAEEQKRKKDAVKRKHDKSMHARDALEKHHRQQARTDFPEKSPRRSRTRTTRTLTFFRHRRRRHRASAERCPHKGLLPGGRGLRGLDAFGRKGRGLAPRSQRVDGATRGLCLGVKA